MAEVEKGPLDKLIDWLNGWKASFRQLRKQFGWPAATLIILVFGWGSGLVELGRNRQASRNLSGH